MLTKGTDSNKGRQARDRGITVVDSDVFAELVKDIVPIVELERSSLSDTVSVSDAIVVREPEILASSSSDILPSPNESVLGRSGLPVPAEQCVSVCSEINDTVKHDDPSNQRQSCMDRLTAKMEEHQQVAEGAKLNAATTKARLEEIQCRLKSLPVPAVKVTATKRPALRIVQQSRCVKAKSDQDNRISISISAGRKSFNAVTTRRGEPHQLDITCLSLQEDATVSRGTQW